MELSIHLECPQCNTASPLLLQDLFPGKPKLCARCHQPLKLTADSLDRFANDVRCYCEN